MKERKKQRKERKQKKQKEENIKITVEKKIEKNDKIINNSIFF